MIADIRRQAIRFEPHVVAGLALAYFVLYSILSVLRHTTFHSFGPDLGIFDQIFWNTTQGRFFESTMSLALPQPHSYFGDHFSPVYLLLLPAYALVPRPETLLVIQTLFLALGVWPIYLLARLKLEPGFQRLVWALVYFLERGQRGLFLLSLLSTFLIKEELPLVGIGFGAYILLTKRDLTLGLGVLGGSVAAFLGLVKVIIPAFGGGSYAYFTGRIAFRYPELGTNPADIVSNALRHPGRLTAILLQPQKLKFLVGIFGPVLGLSAISGFAAILVLPTLGILLLSNYPPQYAFTSHYSATLIPLVIGTSILGFARLPAGYRPPLALAVLTSSLAFSYLFGGLPFSRHFDPQMFRTEPRYAAFAPNMARIPSGASVAAENNLTPHLSQRRYIYDIEYEGVQGADYVALDEAALKHNAATFAEQVRELESQGYRQIATGDGLALLQR